MCYLRICSPAIVKIADDITTKHRKKGYITKTQRININKRDRNARKKFMATHKNNVRKRMHLSIRLLIGK